MSACLASLLQVTSASFSKAKLILFLHFQSPSKWEVSRKCKNKQTKKLSPQKIQRE